MGKQRSLVQVRQTGRPTSSNDLIGLAGLKRKPRAKTYKGGTFGHWAICNSAKSRTGSHVRRLKHSKADTSPELSLYNNARGYEDSIQTVEPHVGSSENFMLKTQIHGFIQSGMVKHQPNLKAPQTHGTVEACGSGEGFSHEPRTKVLKQDEPLENNHVCTSPSYLKTLGRTHSSWIFGAIAELVDNSVDAKASKLEICFWYSREGEEKPLLSIIDNGHGMTHEEISMMLSIGQNAYGNDLGRIGRFGVGFKIGAMKIGQECLILTQTEKSRSIALLSQSFNENKKGLEVPIVSYCRVGSMSMRVDTSVQSGASSEYWLGVIEQFSGFSQFTIGKEFGKFKGRTGTSIYISNLDKWGSDYSLDWEDSSHLGDILIRSKRIRFRPGQISQKVPLDYSLRSYLEVMFLDPPMEIYVQQSLVKSRSLAKSLEVTSIVYGDILGTIVQLTLGRSQRDWEMENCGIFIYWHGRLIEAYKRVGRMVYDSDWGRGVVGVIDVSDVMDDGKDVLVRNDKQGFHECEAYDKLMEWLGQETDIYCIGNRDTPQVETSNEVYEQQNMGKASRSFEAETTMVACFG